MGTKRRLAPIVADALASSRKGPLLDCFSGMCAIGSAVGRSRQIWNNDAQFYAYKVASAMFTSAEHPIDVAIIGDLHLAAFKENKRALRAENRLRLRAEESALSENRIASIQRYLELWRPAVGDETVEKQRLDYVTNHAKYPFALFTLLYADTYFGLSQCIEIDSIVYSLKRLVIESKITTEQQDWLILALGQAMLKCSNTVGHFAQYLEPHVNTSRRYIVQRKRSIREEWLVCVSVLAPAGTASWRKKNKAFHGDCLTLLKGLADQRAKPAVVYADPPYTDDQYSRYYHILETLFAYDYPAIASKGRYRSDRFQTPFSKRSSAVAAFSELANCTVELNAELILSYPANGLLQNMDIDPKELLKQSFQRVEILCETSTTHSTFGASKGTATSPVTEIIYRAKS